MNAFERVEALLSGSEIDRVPFHPLVMQHAARKAGIPLRDYFIDYGKQVDAMFHDVDNFNIECVHPAGYPYCEAKAYGLAVEYPENNLPFEREYLIKDPTNDSDRIRELDIESFPGLMNRVKAVALYREKAGNDLFICGHHEGPFAEYADLRGLTGACMDLLDHPEILHNNFYVITENAMSWGERQIQAGAHAMSIGDAASSQIGPELYRDFVWKHHKRLVDKYHALGVIVKFHICGDISPILPMLIDTGANIIDIDHLVSDIDQYIPLLGSRQVFCGNLDPVTILEQGTPKLIRQQSFDWIHKTGGRGILSGGCEITALTPDTNFHVFASCCWSSEK